MREYYRRLIAAYQQWYPNPQEVVDALIEKISEERGISREDAVMELYKRVYGDYAEVQERRASLGFTEALKLAFNRLRANPVLMVFPLLGESARILGILPLLAFILWLLWTLSASRVPLPPNLTEEGLVEVFSQTQILDVLIVVLALVSLCFLVVLSLGEAIESSFILKGSEKALSGSTVSLEGVWVWALRALPRAFVTALLENTIAFLAPLMVMLVCLDLLLANGGEAASLLFLVLILLLLGYAVIAKLALVFSLPSVVIGDRSPLSALMESLRLFRENIAEVLGLVTVGLAMEILIALLVEALGGFGMLFSGLATLFSLMLVRPLILVALAALYMSAVGRDIDTKRYAGPSIIVLARRLLGESLRELKAVLCEPIWLLASGLLFIAGAYPGFLVGSGEIGKVVWKLAAESARGALGKPTPSILFPGIFFHNWAAALLTAVSGIYTPLAPALVALINGFVLGFVVGIVGVKVAIVGIVPHGVIELPCFIVAVAAGIRLFFRLLSSERPAREIKKALLVAAALMPFLLAAAFIEAFVTPVLLGRISP